MGGSNRLANADIQAQFFKPEKFATYGRNS